MNSEEFHSRWLPLSDALYRLAFYILEDKQDAMDAVQDLYIKVLDSGDKLSEVKSPKSYALQMMHNICIDKVRKAERVQMKSLEGLLLPDDSAQEEQLTGETLQQALNLIDGLPEKQREVVRLRCIEGLEYEDIAVKMGLSENNLRVLLSMARKTIRQNLK